VIQTGKVALAKTQPVNSWNQPSVETVKKRMRRYDVQMGQKAARSEGQRQFLIGLRK